MTNKKVVFDTNLWINFLVAKKLEGLDKFIDNQKIILVTSDELVQEFIEVANRSKFRKWFPKNDIIKVINFFRNHTENTLVKSNVDKCRDKKDNFLLNLAIDSKGCISFFRLVVGVCSKIKEKGGVAGNNGVLCRK